MHSNVPGSLCKLKSLIKLHAAHLGGEETSAVDALRQRHRRFTGDLDPGRAFQRLQRALLVDTPSLSALWAASKRNAKEILWGLPPEHADGEAAVTSPAAHAAHTSGAHAATQEDVQQLQKILGQNGMLRTSLIYILATASRSFMHSLNSTEVHGAEVMERALQRPAGQALITVCNHVAALDDPLVLATIVPPSQYTQPNSIRWTLCASDRCFKYASLSPLFTAAKVLPIQRGGGMQQPGMQAAEDRLQRGEWVHIFPEGTRSQGGGRMGPVRKGVGKLVAAAAAGQAPLVVPFVHTGMEDVLPRGKALPKVGQKVRVLVGEPIPVDDLLASAAKHRWSDDQLYSAVAARVSTHLHVLKTRLESGLPLEADAGVVSYAPVRGGSSDAAEDGEAGVSSLDLYDEADLRWHHRASVWEKMKARMQRRTWLLDGNAMSSPGGLAAMCTGDAAGAGAHRRGSYSPSSSSNGGAGGDAGAPDSGIVLGVGVWESGLLQQYARRRLERVVELLQSSPQPPPASMLSYA